MPRYSLRTLLILLAVGPPLLAVAWFGYLKLSAKQQVFTPVPTGIVEVNFDITDESGR